MNIYEMFYKNNFYFGFWVKRYTWENVVAQIVEIEGFKDGKRPKGCGRYPYFENRKVMADFYDLDTGALLNRSDIKCPGTSGYDLIENPFTKNDPNRR